MKKLFVFLAVCFLALPAFGQDEFPGLQPEKPKENFAFISMMKGKVLLKDELARQNDYVFSDDSIVTEKDAQVEIRFGEQGGHLTIDENSKVFFVEVGSEKSIIAVSWGSVSSHQLEGVEIQTPTGKPDEFIHVNLANDKNDKVEVNENSSLEKDESTVVNESYSPYYSDYWSYWRWYGMYFSCWYPGWYPMFYSCFDYYGRYYGYPYQNRHGYGGNQYQNSGAQRAVDRNQLQSRTIRPSRLNPSNSNPINSVRTNSFRPTRTATNRQTANYPSRISSSSIRPSGVTSSVNARPTTSNTRPKISNRSVRQSPSSSFKQPSSAPRMQQGSTSSYRTPQSSPRSQGTTAPRVSSPSRGSSSSTGRSSGSVNRSTSGGSVRRR